MYDIFLFCKNGEKVEKIKFYFYLFIFRFSFKDRVVCVHHPDAPLIEDYRAGDMICSECGLIVGDR
jgi:hypothetical protein